MAPELEAGERSPDFDLHVLSDPDTDPSAHQSEWRRLFEHFTPRLDGYFATRVPDEAERADLIQDIWHKALLHIAQLRTPAVLWNWLRRVGENRLIDTRKAAATARRRVEEHAAELHFELETSPPLSALEQLVSNPFQGEMGQRFARLSERDQRVVRLAMEAVPHEDIARELRLPSAAASRQLLARIRRTLQGR